jgi:hypothetical protein
MDAVTKLHFVQIGVFYVVCVKTADVIDFDRECSTYRRKDRCVNGFGVDT